MVDEFAVRFKVLPEHRGLLLATFGIAGAGVMVMGLVTTVEPHSLLTVREILYEPVAV
jgi:hypothetical protein